MSKKDLTGQRFGKLVVLREVEPYISPGGKPTRCWLCQCDCGRQTVQRQNALTSKSNPTLSCGCTRLGAHAVDMTGQRFGRLLVIGPTVLDKPLSNGTRTVWHCRCDCGKELDLSRKDLLSGDYKSCGCLLKETAGDRLPAVIGRVDGTTLGMIQPGRTANKNSKSGIKGVYWSNREGCWIAKIGVQNKTITIGRFKDLSKAIAARQAAEEEYFAPMLKKHPEYTPKK